MKSLARGPTFSGTQQKKAPYGRLTNDFDFEGKVGRRLKGRSRLFFEGGSLPASANQRTRHFLLVPSF